MVPWVKALAAFEDLGISDDVPDHIAECAASLVEDLAKAAAESTGPTLEVPTVDQVTTTLMRFNCNQFGFDNGAVGGNPSFSASALYLNISRVNHSCEPSMGMLSKESFCKGNRIAFKVERDGGVLLAYAKHDLQPGDRLTFNYGPSEMLGMPVRERRQLLFERLSFRCGCERCVREMAEETVKCGEASEVLEELEELEVPEAPAKAVLSEVAGVVDVPNEDSGRGSRLRKADLTARGGHEDVPGGGTPQGR